MTSLPQLTLTYLAFSAAVPASWPRSRRQPSTTASRSAALGADAARYNEHLTRDVGNYKLASAILFAWAAWRPSRELVVPVASALLVAALLHAVYEDHRAR